MEDTSSAERNKTMEYLPQRTQRSSGRTKSFFPLLSLPLCPLWLIPLIHDHPANSIPARDSIHNVHPANDAAKDRVATIEVRLWRVRHEPLPAARVFARQGHADRGALVRHFVNLAANRISRTAIPGAPRIAALNYKVRHHAMKGYALEITLAGQSHRII